MASPLSLLIGLRFSRGRRRGGMVSLISVISTVGIALGVAGVVVGVFFQKGVLGGADKPHFCVVPHPESLEVK